MNDGAKQPAVPALRVAQLVQSLCVGGAENLALRIAGARALAGDASHLYYLTEPHDLADRAHSRVVLRFLDFWWSSPRRPLRFVQSLRRGRKRLAEQIRVDGIQVLQTHLPGPNFWGMLLARHGGLPVIATVHNNREFHYGGAGRARVRLRKALYRRILRHSAAVVAVSEDVRSSLIQELGVDEATARRIVVIPNGVPIPDRLRADERQALREEYGASDERPLILGLGRLTRQKNFLDLVEAAAILRERRLPFRLVIAGEGEDRAELESRVAALELSDEVLLPGNVADPHRLMLAADLFAMPSLWEGLPLVLLEAMACGLPVVGNRIPGIVEIVADGEGGRLVSPGEVGELAEALAELAIDAAARARYGEMNLATVRRSYDFTRVSRDLGALYASVVAGPQSP